MRIRSPILFPALALALLLAATLPAAPELSWMEIRLSRNVGGRCPDRNEGIALADVDRDGKMDIISGAWWYRAPNWERHVVRDLSMDREFAGKIFRYVNVPDPVPKLPTVSLIANQYAHCQKEITLGAVGAAEAAVDFFQQLGKKTVDGILNATLLDDLWNGLKKRIAAHGMDSYRKLLADLFKE